MEQFKCDSFEFVKVIPDIKSEFWKKKFQTLSRKAFKKWNIWIWMLKSKQ